MLRFTPYILKTLWRHRSRTVLTVSGSAVALFVFCFVGAVRDGMNDLRHRRQAEQALVVFQAHKFCPATSHLPQDYEHAIAKMPGVREVVPIQVFTNNCRASLDVVVFYGLPAEKLRSVRDFQLTGGSWSAFEQHDDGAMVGRAIARRRGIEPGGKFSIGEITVTVEGIYSCDDLAEENCIYTHLDFLQRGRGQNRVGTVTQFEVLLESDADAAAQCKRLDEKFRSGSVQTSTQPKGVFQANSLGDFTQLVAMSNYLAYACVGLVLALVATTTIMSVGDRIKEHAVLQTIGFSKPLVFGFVLAESVLLSVAGGVVGVGAAMAVLQLSGLAVGAEGVMMAFRPSVALAMNGLLVSLLSGIAAGIAPAWRAAGAEIVSALKQG